MNSRAIVLSEWSRSGPENPVLFGAALGSDAARGRASELHRERLVSILELRDGIQVETRAYVGRIELGELMVTIVPKLAQAELLALVRYALGLKNLRRVDQTRFNGTGALFQDLLAMHLLDEVSRLMERGLIRRYVARSEDLSTPKGRIDLDAYARRQHAGAVVLRCRHHVRIHDHVLNQVLLAGLQLAKRIASDVVLRAALGRLSSRLASEISTLPLSEASLREAYRAINRLSAGYEPALDLIEILYSGSALSLDEHRTITVPGFLFDMNSFFQRLLARFLTEYAPTLEVRTEHTLYGMMRYAAQHNPQRRQSPRPRPDFVVRNKKGVVVALLDAKYRDLWEQSLPPSMLYQLAMYSLSQPRPFTAVILYPTANVAAREAQVEIADPLGAEQVLGRVALRPVHLDQLLEAIDESSDKRVGMELAASWLRAS